MKYWLTALLAMLITPLHAERVVVAGGALTETLFALGMGEQIVAVDSTSRWPEPATALPSVGYFRSLSAEGVLSLRPDLVLLDEQAGPVAVVEALQRTVTTAQLAAFSGPSVLPKRVRELAALVHREPQGEQLAQQLSAQLAALKQSPRKDAPTVLLLLAAGPRGVMVAGQGTPAEEMLNWLGLPNAAANVHGYKPVSAEAMLALQPEVLIVAETEPDSFSLAAHPVLLNSPAAKNQRVLIADITWLLGMGPRLPEALKAIRDTATQQAM